MIKSHIPSIIAFVGGALLAELSIRLNFSTGWVGAGLLISWALYARRQWSDEERVYGLEPSAPERVVRLRAIGVSLLCGHLLAAIAHTEIDMHIGNENTLAIDSWMMIVAMFISIILFRDDEKIQDERDAGITATGMKAGYYSLIVLLIILLLFLGFASPSIVAPFKPFMLGNFLIALILISILVKLSVQIHAYSHDTRMDMQVDVNGMLDQ